jgi:hypothetical protein
MRLSGSIAQEIPGPRWTAPPIVAARAPATRPPDPSRDWYRGSRLRVDGVHGHVHIRSACRPIGRAMSQRMPSQRDGLHCAAIEQLACPPGPWHTPAARAGHRAVPYAGSPSSRSASWKRPAVRAVSAAPSDDSCPRVGSAGFAVAVTVAKAGHRSACHARGHGPTPRYVFRCHSAVGASDRRRVRR